MTEKINSFYAGRRISVKAHLDCFTYTAHFYGNDNLHFLLRVILPK